jgi:hypothetical protein
VVVFAFTPPAGLGADVFTFLAATFLAGALSVGFSAPAVSLFSSSSSLPSLSQSSDDLIS